MKHNIPFYLLITFGIMLLFSGCSASKVTVNTHHFRNTNLSELKTFGIARINSKAPEIERKLLKVIRKDLEAKGFHYKNQNPDFMIAIHFYQGNFAKYVPPLRLTLRDFNPDRSGQREQTLRNRGIRRTQTDRMSEEIKKSVHQFDGYVEKNFYQNIQVYFVKIVDKESLKMLWHGEVESRNKKADILTVAPVMLKELMTEFPKETSKPHERHVRL